MAKNSPLPSFGLVITAPGPLVDTARMKRIHEKATRLAIEEALLGYWRTEWKDHFSAPARGKYQYLTRSSGYKKMKKEEFHSITDNVASGRTKSFMSVTRPKFTIAKGSIFGVKRSKADVGITGRLTMKFPFPVTAKTGEIRKDGKPKISPTDMARELSTWSETQMWHAASVFIAAYEKHFSQLLGASVKVKTKHGKGTA
ncbi:MAG: hypothetical protein ACYC4U_10280 [Pirellulaceae bacterium]